MSVPRVFHSGLLVLLSACILFAACSDDQGADDPGDVPEPTMMEPVYESESDVELGYDVASTSLVRDYKSVDALVQASDLVVRGTVTEILDPITIEPGEPPFEEQDPEMYPPTGYADVVLEVSEFFKGEDETSIAIRQLSGTVEGVIREYEDVLEFATGDDLILFLADHRGQGYGDVYWVTGVFQGFWEVRPDGDVQPFSDKYGTRHLDDFRDELAEYAVSQ